MPFLFCEKLVQQVFSGYLADACKRVQVTMEHTMDGWVSAEPRASLVQAAQPMVTALAPNLLRILARLWTSTNITSKVDRAYMFLVRGSELARLLNSDYSRPKGQFEAEKASKETSENWTDQSHPKPPEDAESGQALGEKALDVAKKASKVEAFLPGLSSDPAKPWLLSCVGAQKDASCGETCMSTTKLVARCTCKRACAYFCQQHCNELGLRRCGKSKTVWGQAVVSQRTLPGIRLFGDSVKLCGKVVFRGVQCFLSCPWKAKNAPEKPPG